MKTLSRRLENVTNQKRNKGLNFDKDIQETVPKSKVQLEQVV